MTDAIRPIVKTDVINTGVRASELGGLEGIDKNLVLATGIDADDIGAAKPADIPPAVATGTVTPRVGAISFAGGSTGHVLQVVAGGALVVGPLPAQPLPEGVTKLHIGDGPPGQEIGVNGDQYIDKVARALYGPKTAGSWGTPTLLSEISKSQVLATGLTAADLGALTGISKATVLATGLAPADIGAATPAQIPPPIATTVVPRTGTVSLTGGSVGDVLQVVEGGLAIGPLPPSPPPTDIAVFIQGEGPPAPEIGRDGDSYFDKTNRALYGPKIAGAWGEPILLSQQMTTELILALLGPEDLATVLENDPDVLVDLINDALGQTDWQNGGAATSNTLGGLLPLLLG